MTSANKIESDAQACRNSQCITSRVNGGGGGQDNVSHVGDSILNDSTEMPQVITR